MQIQPPIKTYTLRSGRNHTPIQPPVKPAQTNNTTNGEKNGDKGNGDKENVMPGKPAKVVTQKKKVAKPVRDSKVPTEPVRQGIVTSVSRQGIVASVSRRRKTLTNVVTPEANSSGEVVSNSNVLTEPVKQSVAIVSRKRKVVSNSNVLTEPVQQSVAIVSRKRKVVSNSNVLKEPVKQSVTIVSRKRKAKLLTEDYGGSIAKVKTRKRQGVVQTDDVISNVKPASASKKIKKPTLVPSAVIPSISDYDDDDSQFSQSLDEEENAYREQLVASQKSGKGKGKGKVKKDLPEGATIFCTKCHEVFDNADQLSVHEKKCFIGRHYPCPYAGCSHVNSQNSLLDEHIKGVHENNSFRCELCPQEVFIYKKSYNKHFKRYHQSSPENRNKFKYLCENCDFVLDNRTEYQTHVDRNRNMKRYKCNVCESAYFTQSQLTNHLKNSCSSVVEDNKYECSVCGKQLKSED